MFNHFSNRRLAAAGSYAALILASFFLLRVIPVGVVMVSTSEASNYGVEPVIRPHFLVPRELAFAGWPVPGGGFSIIGDPHFRSTAPLQLDIDTADGAVKSLIVEGIDINQNFKRDNLRESIIAVWENGNLYEVSVKAQEIVMRRRDQIFLAGFAENYIAFLIASVPHETGSEAVVFDEALVVTNYPFSTRRSEIFFRGDPGWNRIVRELRSVNYPQELISQLCSTSSRPARDFLINEIRKECY